MFELQAQQPAPELSCPASVLRWRARRAPAICLVIFFAGCWAGVCVLSHGDQTGPILSWICVTDATWLGFLFGYLFPSLARGLEIHTEGLRLRSLFRSRDVNWNDVDEVLWRFAPNQTEPLTRAVLLRMGVDAVILTDATFLGGSEPPCDAIVRNCRPCNVSGFSEDWIQRYCSAEIRRFRRLAFVLTLLTIGTLSILKVTGVLASSFSWTVVVLAPIMVFLLVGVLLGRLLRLDRLRELRAFRSMEDYETAELPFVSRRGLDPRSFLYKLSFRYWFPPPPDKILTEDQIRELRHRMTRLDRQATPLGLILMVTFIAAFTCIPYRLALLLQEPVIDPVLDTRSRDGVLWLGPGLFLGMVVGVAAMRPIFRWRHGREESHLFSCYQTTLKGYDIRRSMRYIHAILLTYAAFGALAAWHTGYVVDQNGIRFKPGLVSSYSRSYSDVHTIGVYGRFDAPIGIQKGPLIRITFREGPPLVESLKPSDTRFDEWLQAVEYISQRCGVPVEHGDMAPKD